VVGAVCTNPNNPPITFGDSSPLLAKYNWSHSSSPNTGVLSVPVVLDVVGDPRPEIFLSYFKPPSIPQCSLSSTGYLVALHVVNGSLVPLWELTQLRTLPFSHLAVSKVPNTINEAIVCAFNSTGTGFFCADATTGAVLLTQNMAALNQCHPQVSTWSALSIERLFPDEVDPSLFIIVQSQVFRYDSVTRTTSFRCAIPWTTNAIDIPFAIDIDLDGTAELFSQNCVYRASDCSLLWCSSPSLVWVFPAVANIDTSTPEAEVVMAGKGRVTLYNHKGDEMWSVSIASNYGGPPTIADFNRDGVPDIGFSCYKTYFVISGIDGAVLKSYTVQDTSTVTGSSTFDFENDGAYEMVYVSNDQTYIFSMNWTKTFNHSASTATEYSLTADIDLDGSADILAIGNFPVTVLGTSDTLPEATNSWTSHGYNSRKLDRLNYPRVMTAASTFRSGDKPRFRVHTMIELSV